MRNCTIVLPLFAAVAVFSLVETTQADLFTWTGGGADDLWTNPANWGGTGPDGNDTARFTSTGGGGFVDIGAATITDRVELRSGADGYDFIGSGVLNGQFDFNTTGNNTFSCQVRPTNNHGVSGGGTMNVADFDRGDTIYRSGTTTINVLNGGELAFNRLRTNGGGTTVNVEAGGLIDCRYVFHLDANETGTIDVSGTVAVPNSSGTEWGIDMNYDNNRVIIRDGGLVYGYLTLHDDGDGSDSTVDMEPGARLALRGGSAAVDTLAEFYALTKGEQGLDGDNFRYGDGITWTNFDAMTGTDWYTLTYDPNFMQTGVGYSVLETLETGPDIIPEPSALLIWALGLLGLVLCGRRRKR